MLNPNTILVKKSNQKKFAIIFDRDFKARNTSN